MLFTVQQLIAGCPTPTIIGPEQTGLEALNLMIQHDYSQLPVVDGDSRLIGLITGDSLLRAVNSLGVLPKELRVKDAQLKPRTASVDSDVFDLLDDLKAAAAVLILDAAQQLVGVVTDYDAMDFFRRHSEDMMLVEDIETSLKDHIRAASTTDGQADDRTLAAAIADVADPQKKQAEQFRKAINHYLGLAGSGAAAKPNASLVQQVVAAQYPDKARDISLDDLTMAQYVDVLLHKSRQAYIDRVFPVGAQAVRTLFASVRPIRNALFHFRGSIMPEQRNQLRYCAEWLAGAFVAPRITAEQTASNVPAGLGSAGGAEVIASDERATSQPTPSGAQASLGDSVTEPHAHETGPIKIAATGPMRVVDYAQLTAYLKEQPSDRKVESMAFGEIERVTGGSLPEAARLHRSWWSNDASTFAYARAWTDAGWRVTADMADEVATFTRDRS